MSFFFFHYLHGLWLLAYVFAGVIGIAAAFVHVEIKRRHDERLEKIMGYQYISECSFDIPLWCGPFYFVGLLIGAALSLFLINDAAYVHHIGLVLFPGDIFLETTVALGIQIGWVMSAATGILLALDTSFRPFRSFFNRSQSQASRF